MSDQATAEFEKALHKYLLDSELSREDDLVTGWMVLAESTGMGEELNNGFKVVYSPGLSFVRQLGLTESASTWVRSLIAGVACTCEDE